MLSNLLQRTVARAMGCTAATPLPSSRLAALPSLPRELPSLLSALQPVPLTKPSCLMI